MIPTAKIVIVGAGPAGITFFDTLVKRNKSILGDNNIFLIDKDGGKCQGLSSHGIYLENLKSKCPSELKFLVDGKITGPEIVSYFEKQYPYTPFNFKVAKIEKKNNAFLLSTLDNKKIVAEIVVLATGISPKKINCIGYDKDSIYNKTFASFEDLTRLNFNESEIIFVGSGKNAAVKSGRLAHYLIDNNIPYSPKCIKIFTKSGFDSSVYTDFLDENKKYLDMDIIDVYKNVWSIRDIKLGRNNLIKKIITPVETYISEFKKGAYLSVHIGFEMNIPILVHCVIDDFILAGDIDRLKRGAVCTIYDAILDAQKKAKNFIDR